MKFDIKKCVRHRGRGCFFIDRLGFTLIELMIVIAIVSLLAAAVFVTVNPSKRLGQAQDAKRFSDLIAIAKAIELYSADNGNLPADFDVDNVSSIKKIVLCSGSDSLTCDGQTRDCLVVDDADFLDKYLLDLPVDPKKSGTDDTGYYISRGQGDAIVLGACSHYKDNSLQVVSAMNMPNLVTVCGDGDTEGDEICDDGNLVAEGCGNGALETSGTYCNATCAAIITIASSEVCDYDIWTDDCQTFFSDGEGGFIYATESDVGSFFCLDTCSTYKQSCGGG